ncbi:hypothetical protein AALP_AA8G212000 [Arabis alpina]|uniref:Uncharacterized protein n=1 Tax=Arabis alpina TaxID=50452 RepID=A0A087G8G8_ARAAL|nr:hypothetical protein AALP_AA8G212000 [Arabis alpina]
MGKKRSFRELASGSAGASEAAASPSTTSAPKTVPTPSTAPALAPSTTSVPSSTPVPSTTSASKNVARVPPSVVLGVPATDSKASRSSVPLAFSRSGEDARKNAKAKAHKTATSDHRRSEPRSDGEREPKRTRTDPPSPFVRVSQLVFDDDAAAARLFATMVFPDVPYTRVRASSSGTMSRAGLKAEIEKQKRRADNYAKGEIATKTERNKYAEQLDKRNNELERALRDNKRLRVENEKLAKKLETAKQDASNSLTFLTRRNEQVDELKKQVKQKRKLLKTAKALIVDLHEKFAIAKAKFVELKRDPQDKMIYQVQREVNLDFEMRIDSAGLLKNLMISVDGRMSFAGENEAEVTMTAVADPEAEKTRIGGEATEIEKAVADEDGAERAVSEKAGLTTLVTSTEVVKDAEVHP